MGPRGRNGGWAMSYRCPQPTAHSGRVRRKAQVDRRFQAVRAIGLIERPRSAFRSMRALAHGRPPEGALIHQMKTETSTSRKRRSARNFQRPGCRSCGVAGNSGFFAIRFLPSRSGCEADRMHMCTRPTGEHCQPRHRNRGKIGDQSPTTSGVQSNTVTAPRHLGDDPFLTLPPMKMHLMGLLSDRQDIQGDGRVTRGRAQPSLSCPLPGE